MYDRLMYALMLMLGTGFMCISLTPRIEEILEDNVNSSWHIQSQISSITLLLLVWQIPHFGATCELLKIGEKCELLVGYMAVYRTAFALSGFFFLMSLVTIGIKRSRGFRAGFHNGAWLWKFLLLIGIGVGVFCLPSERIAHFQIGSLIWLLHHFWFEKIKFWILARFPVWMYIALVGAVAFVLIQLWLLVFFARSLANKINHKVAQGGSAVCWYGGKYQTERFKQQSIISLYEFSCTTLYFFSNSDSVFDVHDILLRHHCRRHNGAFQFFYDLGRLHSQQDLYWCQRRLVPFAVGHIRPDMLWTKYDELAVSLFHLQLIDSSPISFGLSQEKLTQPCSKRV